MKHLDSSIKVKHEQALTRGKTVSRDCEKKKHKQLRSYPAIPDALPARLSLTALDITLPRFCCSNTSHKFWEAVTEGLSKWKRYTLSCLPQTEAKSGDLAHARSRLRQSSDVAEVGLEIDMVAVAAPAPEPPSAGR